MKDLSRHSKPLKVIPLGGVGAFGMNMMLFEYGHDIVLVDVGLMFPDPDLLGVDIVIPDFTYLRNPTKQLLGVFLTHGHMDHIGAVPYLLREMNAPIYGTTMTLGFLADRLKAHRQDLFSEIQTDASAEDRLPVIPTVQLVPIQPGVPITLGPFSIEAIPVTHSIVESVAYAITTPVGCLIHTGDFKIDPTPVRGAGFDPTRFIEHGRLGVLALFSDSTNSERAGHCASERSVGETFGRLFSKIEGRIFVATFASNLHRIDQIAQSAAQCGRKLFMTGKGLTDAIRIGREAGYSAIPTEQALPLHALSHTSDREVVVMTTGSQGEPTSALSKMAIGDHKEIHLKEGDTVILSARVIPGNEADVTKMINHLLRRGVRVVQEKEVHASGHAHRDEQKQMIEWVNPRYFIPVHGDYRQLLAHADVAAQTGLSSDRIRVIENGDTLLLTPDACQSGKPVPAERILIDGRDRLEVSTLSDRRYLSSEGILVVTVDIYKVKLCAGPFFVSRGFVQDDPDLPLWKALRTVIERLFETMESELGQDAAPPPSEEIEKQVRGALKKWISKKLRRYPLILPNVRRVDRP